MRIFSFSAVVLFFFCLGLYPSQSQAFYKFFSRSHKPVKAVNGEVRLPLNSVDDGEAHYFSFNSEQGEIRFFVLKSRDNIIRAAFDACDVCFPEKKGYSRDGDYMICNNCGQKFHSTRINVIKGGCNPAPLRRTRKGDQLVIQVSDILSGSHYF